MEVVRHEYRRGDFLDRNISARMPSAQVLYKCCLMWVFGVIATTDIDTEEIRVPTDFLTLPCGINCLDSCEIHNTMVELQKSLVPPPENGAASLIRAFLASYRELCQSSPTVQDAFSPDVALPALFDLAVSAGYAERMVSDGGWLYCAGTDYPSEGPSLFFPFLKTCPRSSAKLGKRPAAQSNKPGSDIIGQITGDVTIQILTEIIGQIDTNVKLAKSSLRQGDVDAVIYDDQIVALVEIKSSPLVVYPLEIKLERQMTEVRGGESLLKRDHSPATVDTNSANLLMYIPHIDLRISLGSPADNNWPYSALIDFVLNSENVATLISAWRELYHVYTQTRGQRGTIDNRKWLTCGCGGGVDDSKNAPGMDRTDDIKKGTYQVLKLGTYYKEKCSRQAIRAVLASNFMPLHTFDHYLAEMEDVLWTKEKYSVALDGVAQEDGIVAFETSGVFNLYDALLCLTRSIYHDDHLWEISSLDQFAARICQ
jgi:hypothetical protein